MGKTPDKKELVRRPLRHNQEDASVADFFAELRRLLSDTEAAKRIDSLIAIWKSNIDARSAQAKEQAIANERAFKLRTWISCVVVVGVCVLGALKVITGDAVVGMLGGFFGYLWGSNKASAR